ncbi:MAG: ribonuclease III [Bacteroidetes bacterium]|nr:ribonuclease III [Bacteroidota bacterium]
MYPIFKPLRSIFKSYSSKEKKLIIALESIVGDKPYNLDLYKLATQHSSIAKASGFGIKLSNERLEYLGDAILGAVVAELLFQKFPFKDEGILTEIRSRIVNRESLNNLGKKIGINNIVEFDAHKKTSLSHKSLYGDTLEALIGAIYLDKGFIACKKFIIKKLFAHHLDLDEIIKDDPNFKSRIIEWAQKQNKELKFETVEIKTEKNYKEFTSQVFINGQSLCNGFGLSKKKAEQDASQKTCVQLNIP